MSKRRRTNPNNKFVMLERWFWRCPAWRALPHPARSLYIELEMLFTGDNNGTIPLGVRKAMVLIGCSFNFTRKMFAEIEEKGFARASQRGAFSWKNRHTTTWILTRYERNGKPPTAEFMRWRPAEKQNTDAPQASDGRSTRVRGTHKVPLTDAPQESVMADSDPFTDAPQASLYSIPPVSPSKTASLQTKSNAAHMKRARPAAAAASSDGSVNQLSGPKGSQASKTQWLRACLESGVVRVADVAAVLKLEERDVGPIANGRTTIASTAWSKLAALVHGRIQ